MKSISLVCALAVLVANTARGQAISAVEPLAEGLYKITVDGGWKATVVAFTGTEGLLIIDSGFKGTAEALEDTLKSLGHSSPRFLINTHSHKDHTGGNSLLGRGAIVIAREGMRSKLKVGSLVLEDYTQDALPDIVVKDEAVLHFNEEDIVIKAFPGGHDVTDLIVWFKHARIAYLGDLAYGMHFPSTDYYTGSLVRYPEIISAIIDYLPPGTRIVSGHGRDYSYQEMIVFRDMLSRTQAIIAEQAGKGLTAREIVDGGFLDAWKEYSDPEMMATEGYVSTTLRNLQHLPMPTKNILGTLYETSKMGDGDAIYEEYQKVKASEAEAYGLTNTTLRPVLVYYMYLLAERLTDQARFGDALGVFRILRENYPETRDTPRLFTQMGEAYMALYDFKSARDAFEKVLELSPDDENARQRLSLLDGLGR